MGLIDILVIYFATTYATEFWVFVLWINSYCVELSLFDRGKITSQSLNKKLPLSLEICVYVLSRSFLAWKLFCVVIVERFAYKEQIGKYQNNKIYKNNHTSTAIFGP